VIQSDVAQSDAWLDPGLRPLRTQSAVVAQVTPSNTILVATRVRGDDIFWQPTNSCELQKDLVVSRAQVFTDGAVVRRLAE